MIKTIIEQLRRLDEMPKLKDREYPTAANFAHVSSDALDRSYNYVGITDSGVSIYEKTNGSGFLCGFESELGNLIHIIDIRTRRKSYPSVPRDLSSDYHQVSWVHVVDEYAESGYTRDVYDYLAKITDLVSDHEQYIGAQRLWQSLARAGTVNVYVWDGGLGDYSRDTNGDIIRYTGKNISERYIWGDSIDHADRLLVATTKNFN